MVCTLEAPGCTAQTAARDSSSSSNIVAIVVIVIIAAAATRLTEMPCNLKRLRDGHYFCDDKQSACIV